MSDQVLKHSWRSFKWRFKEIYGWLYLDGSSL